MLDVKKYIIKHFVKIKVIHSMPGRIRLKLPNASKLPEECNAYDQYVKLAVTMLNGIEEVSFNYVIGTVLIKYDVDKVYEGKILKWIQKMIQIGIDNIDLIQNYGEKNLDYVIKTLEQQLKEAIDTL